jgi:hypothetical protein
VNIYDNFLQQSSVFEDDDDEKGLMEYLRRGKRGGKGKTGSWRRSGWRQFFCCCVGDDD